MEQSPWTFGTTHLLTVAGLLLSAFVAYRGFKKFDDWKRERIEEKRIEIAIEALTLAYETERVFAAIRSPMASSQEWADMPRQPGEREEDTGSRGTFYATLKRVDANLGYFQRIDKIRPRLMALFGSEHSALFAGVHEARSWVIVAARMLFQERLDRFDPKLRLRLEADVWDGMASVYKDDELAEGDRVGRRVKEFVEGVEKLCRPVVDRKYSRKR